MIVLILCTPIGICLPSSLLLYSKPKFSKWIFTSFSPSKMKRRLCAFFTKHESKLVASHFSVVLLASLRFASLRLLLAHLFRHVESSLGNFHSLCVGREYRRLKRRRHVKFKPRHQRGVVHVLVRPPSRFANRAARLEYCLLRKGGELFAGAVFDGADHVLSRSKAQTAVPHKPAFRTESRGSRSRGGKKSGDLTKIGVPVPPHILHQVAVPLRPDPSNEGELLPLGEVKLSAHDRVCLHRQHPIGGVMFVYELQTNS